jgi:hypothetical protein
MLLNPFRRRGLFAANGGKSMPESNCPLVERVARVLAGAAHSSNAEGSDPSAGEKVDLVWREHVNQALAVLHTMREPDEAQAAVGDADMWRNMVEAAIAQHVD